LTPCPLICYDLVVASEPENERFQELTEAVLETIRALEFEIRVYQYAASKLRVSSGIPVAATFFESALKAGDLSRPVRQHVVDKKRERMALFQLSPQLELDSKLVILTTFLETFRQNNSDLFSTEPPLKDAL
jgi:hypothetical protein